MRDGGDGDLICCELLVDLGEARWPSGDETAAREALIEAADLARELGQGELLARAALGYGCGLGDAGNAVDQLEGLCPGPLRTRPNWRGCAKRSVSSPTVGSPRPSVSLP